MSLFPAYASEDVSEAYTTAAEEAEEARAVMEWSPTWEAQLLATPDDAEATPPPAAASAAVADKPAAVTRAADDFYLDRKLDRGNLPVSTLYYPGRPEYRSRGAPVGGERGRVRKKHERARRYFHIAPARPDPGDPSDPTDPRHQLARRRDAYQRLLAERPHDEDLWLRFLDFQELCEEASAESGGGGGGAGGAAAACEAACDRLPHSSRLRARLHRALQHALPTDQYLTRLRDLIAQERNVSVRLELWLRLVGAVARGGGGAGGAGGAGCAGRGLVERVRAAAAAALHDTRTFPPAYPHILWLYGSFLRSGGLWEQLVLLVELVAATMHPAGPFPPPGEPALEAAVEARLHEYEERAMRCGLPASTVWARVERARAAAHWRAGEALAADPQRAPLLGDVAELVAPAHVAAALPLAAALLRACKVPLLPGGAWAARAAAAGAGGAPAEGGWEAGGGEALLVLLRAARRLPPAHPARLDPRLAKDLLARTTDPQHYLTETACAGYTRWVNALWEACCGWVSGEQRTALVCWRLRWLHARALLLDPQEEAAEVRRLREAARGVLRAHAHNSALPYAQFARLELVAGGRERAQAAALHALRFALPRAGHERAPPHVALYVARVVRELAPPAPAAWALVCAALARPLPADLAAPPPADLLRRAYAACCARCDDLDAAEAPPGEEEEEWRWALERALAPSAAEWGAARSLLAPPADRPRLLQRLLALAGSQCQLGRERLRLAEQSACALVEAAAQDHRAHHYARALLPLAPDNALLALMSSGAPLWAWPRGVAGGAGAGAGEWCGVPVSPRGDTPALAALLPHLLRAARHDWAPHEAERVARVCRRWTRAGGGGALAWALRLEAEARAPHSRPSRLAATLYAALDNYPHHKWLHVRGAEWCGAEGAALADLLLDNQLRLHTLRDELEPLDTALTADHAAA